jgi:hypothetical protein
MKTHKATDAEARIEDYASRCEAGGSTDFSLGPLRLLTVNGELPTVNFFYGA